MIAGQGKSPCLLCIQKDMTVECEELIKTLGFEQTEFKTVEYMLTRASPMRIVQAVKRYSKGQKHNAEWYLPLFKNGYIKSDYAFDCSFDEDFWKAYQIFDSVCEIHTFDLSYIDAMRVSISRIRKALRTSRVMNVHYVFKVWQDTQEDKIINNADKIQQVFKSNVAKVVDL
jgi:hypothetical protein